MRKIAFALITLGLVAAAAPSMAASLVFDTFSYSNGNLVPNGGWANYSGANVDVQVAAGQATGGAIPNNQNDDHLLFAPQSLGPDLRVLRRDDYGPGHGAAPEPVFFAC